MSQMRLARPAPWGSELFPVHPDADYKRRVVAALNSNQPVPSVEHPAVCFSAERHPEGPAFEVAWKLTPRGARFILATRRWRGCVTQQGVDHSLPEWWPWVPVGVSR